MRATKGVLICCIALLCAVITINQYVNQPRRVWISFHNKELQLLPGTNTNVVLPTINLVTLHAQGYKVVLTDPVPYKPKGHPVQEYDMPLGVATHHTTVGLGKYKLFIYNQKTGRLAATILLRIGPVPRPPIYKKWNLSNREGF